MRRKNGGELVPNEVRVLRVALDLQLSEGQFHGYQILRKLAPTEEGGRMLNNSTLYRALRRFEGLGLMESTWEADEDAAADQREGRPRRYYHLTAHGVEAARALPAIAAAGPRKARADGVVKNPGLA